MIVRTDVVPEAGEGETHGSPPPAGLGPPHEPLLSPSIQVGADDPVHAYELKMVLPAPLADELESWAAQAMDPDPFCQGEGKGYETTTLYLDTPRFDVFHRSPGFRRRKYRLRRYGAESVVYLERKARRADRVRKRRSHVKLDDLPRLEVGEAQEGWAGEWFLHKVKLKDLKPACRITYRRTAFVKSLGPTSLRLTFDRQIRGRVADGWELAPVEPGQSILPEHVVCEFKFRDSLPTLFKEIILSLRL
jgi:hypothetical protein